MSIGSGILGHIVQAYVFVCGLRSKLLVRSDASLLDTDLSVAYYT